MPQSASVSRRYRIVGAATRQGIEMQALEGRRLMAAGGGWTSAGLVGDYYANSALTGLPAFVRKDVRLNFDWGTVVTPGGSNSAGFNAVGHNNFSALWTGQLMAKYSETYTFTGVADDAMLLQIRPTGSSSWTTVFNQTVAVANGTSGQFALTAGTKYDVQVTYKQYTGAAAVKLMWSSPSTPQEVIDPMTEVGFNVQASWAQGFTDIVKDARNSFGGVDGLAAPAQDANGWPMGNALYYWQESLNQGLDIDPMEQGTITFSFNGKATVAIQGNVTAGSLTYSYNAATNLTTGSFVGSPQHWNASSIQFRNTDRDGVYHNGLPDNDGITNLKMMKPVATGSTTSFTSDVIFQPQLESALANFTTLRVNLNNSNQESNWSDRTLPGYFNQAEGKTTNRLYSTGDPVSNGTSWEYEVMLANETGRDLYINIPMPASGWSVSDTQSYVYKLAQLIKYGSDGVNPYTQTVANPVYPGLNSNLKVYIELSNEYWNYGGAAFQQSGDLDAMVAADADAYLNGGVSPSGDPRAQPADFAVYNYDNLPTTKNSSGQYDSLGTWRKRKMIVRLTEISNIFRAVYGDSAMPGTSADPTVRPIYEWQYANANNTASDALSFMENYYNNGDGVQHVATPHAPSYYLWGGGGATYYGSGNQWGIVGGQMADPSFESPVVGSGYTADPTGSNWTFTGTAGIARDGGSGDDIPPGAWLYGDASQTATSQMAYLTGTGTMQSSFTLPATQTSNVYAISFKAVQRTAVGSSTPDTQKLQVYVDGVLVNAKSYSQSGGYQPDAYNVYNPWYARVVAWTTSEYYQTLTFTGLPGSTHTVKFVGLNAGQTAFVDDVEVSSVDAIFAGGMPASGSFANGQTATTQYTADLATQVNWGAAYGLRDTGYEGGWALGGDTGGSPLQNYAKYSDARAGTANVAAFNDFTQAGGTLNTMGTYEQWPNWADNYTPAQEGLLNLATNTLYQGQLSFLSGAPAAVTNGVTLTGGTQVLTSAAATLQYNASGTSVSSSGWDDWNVISTAGGQYNAAVDASAGATLQVMVDGKVVDTFASGDALTRAPVTFVLSSGLHSIRVKAVGGTITVNSVTIRPGQGSLTGAALAVYELAGNAYNATNSSPSSVSARATVGKLTDGAGYMPNTQTPFGGGQLVQPLTTGANANVYAQDLNTAITRNEYESFTVSAASGYSLGLSSVFLNTYFQNTPAARGVGLRYSLDGVNFTTVGSYTGTNADAPTFNLAGISALANVTGTVTLRVYLFGGTPYSTTGIGGKSGNDLVVYGSAARVIPAGITVSQLLTDTGSSASDRITNLNNSSAGSALQFLVTGLVAGATVTLYDGATVIGTGTASGSSLTVTTNGVTTLADGVHGIAANQSLEGTTSEMSAAMQVTIDTVAPVLSGLNNVSKEAVSTSGTVVTFTNPTATDAIDGSPVVGVSPASGGTFAMGVTTVTVTATDKAGNVATGTFSVSVNDPAWLVRGSGAAYTFTSPLNLNVTGGTVSLVGDAGAASTGRPGLVINGQSGSLIRILTSQRLGGLTLAGATAAVVAGNGVVLDLGGLAVDATGTLDLTDGAGVIRGGDIGVVSALLQRGINADVALWTGTGITSSLAAADASNRHAVGAIQNTFQGGAIYDTFHGLSVGTGDVLLAYTVFGDADLSGTVDDTDYFLTNNGYSQGLTGWLNGDFDYSGAIDDTDYFLLNSGFAGQ